MWTPIAATLGPPLKRNTTGRCESSATPERRYDVVNRRAAGLPALLLTRKSSTVAVYGTRWPAIVATWLVTKRLGLSSARAEEMQSAVAMIALTSTSRTSDPQSILPIGS